MVEQQCKQDKTSVQVLIQKFQLGTFSPGPIAK